MPSAKRGLQMTSEATVAVVEFENERPMPWTMRRAMARVIIGTNTYPNGARPMSTSPITRAILRTPLSSHQPTKGRTMTAMNEKTAAQMPATASVPPRLWMKNGKVARLMMWFVNTQRFTRMMRTRSRVQSLVPDLRSAGCPTTAVLLSDMKRPFERQRRKAARRGRRRATSLQAAEMNQSDLRARQLIDR